MLMVAEHGHEHLSPQRVYPVSVREVIARHEPSLFADAGRLKKLHAGYMLEAKLFRQMNLLIGNMSGEFPIISKTGVTVNIVENHSTRADEVE